MIGDLIAKERIKKGVTKSELAKSTNINIGHLTHIEKGERNPSHKALKSICNALELPYQPLMYTYDKEISEEQKSYNAANYISCNKILSINSIDTFIDCPPSVPSSAIALRMPDDSMEPVFKKSSYLYIELNTPLNTKDYGLFFYNGRTIVRKFIYKKEKIFLHAENKKYAEICIFDEDNFYIIGKILKNK